MSFSPTTSATIVVLTFGGILTQANGASNSDVPPVKNPVIMTALPGGQRVNTITKSSNGYEFIEWKHLADGTWTPQLATRFDGSFSVNQRVDIRGGGQSKFVEMTRTAEGAWKPVYAQGDRMLSDSDYVLEGESDASDRQYALERVNPDAKEMGRRYVRESVESSGKPMVNVEATKRLRQAVLNDPDLSIDIARIGVSDDGETKVLWGIVSSDQAKRALTRHFEQTAGTQQTQNRLLVGAR